MIRRSAAKVYHLLSSRPELVTVCLALALGIIWGDNH